MPDVKDFIPELVCLGLDAMICSVMYFGYRHAANIVKDLSEAEELEISSGLKKQIESHTLAVKSGNSTSIPYAVIRGNVSPMGRTVSSAYKQEIQDGVLQKVVFTEHKRNLSRTGFWVDSERLLHQYANETPFCLQNPKASSLSMSLTRPRVEVCDWAQAAILDLDTIHDEFESGQNTFTNHLLGWIQGDFHKGTQITETMLRKDTGLTAIGELVSSPEGVQIKPPSDHKYFFLVKSSLASLIKDYQIEKDSYKGLTVFFSGIGLVIIAVGLYRYWRKRKEELVVETQRNTINDIIADRENHPERENVPENFTCVICLGAPREVILLPCGHVCMCADCSRELLNQNHQCPVCRGHVESLHQAFVS